MDIEIHTTTTLDNLIMGESSEYEKVDEFEDLTFITHGESSNGKENKVTQEFTFD